MKNQPGDIVRFATSVIASLPIEEGLERLCLCSEASC